MNKKHIILFIFISLVLFEIAMLFTGSFGQEEGKTANEDDRLNIPQAHLFNNNFWAEKIREFGSEQAYEVFKTELSDIDAGRDVYAAQHIAAHHFGEALYKEESVAGVVVCDNTFAFGCFHQFFLSAISDQGIEVVSELEGECIEKFGAGDVGCVHGIGHGAMDLFGRDGLDEALSVCDSLQWDGPILGCKHGVFMEYSFPAAMDTRKTSGVIRELDPKNLHFPCLNVDKQHQPQCYFSQAPWWLLSSFTPAEVADLCREAEYTIQKYCFMGLGDTLVDYLSHRDKLVIEKCGEISDNVEEEIYCRAGAHFGFWKIDSVEVKNKSWIMCEYEEKESCLKEVGLWTS